VVSKFRYSCAFVDWRPDELEELANLWARAYKHAYKVQDSTPQCLFRGPSARASLAIQEPVQVLCRETMGVLTQSLALDDDLRSEIQSWAQTELRGMGCCTWAEFEVEVRLATAPSTPLPTLFHRLAWCASTLRSSVDWGSLLGLSSLGQRGLVAQTQRERTNAGLGKGSEQDWVKLLRMLVESGCWREDQVVHHGRFWLPASLRGKPSGNGEAARMLAEHYGVPVGFMAQAGGEADSAGAGEPTAMVPCVGDQLISGKVRWPSTNGFIAGEVVAFCAARERYTVRLAGGVQVEASLSELRQHWDTRPRAGPYADGKACAVLQRSVLEIRAYRERQVLRREPLLWIRPRQATEWWEERKEYQCVLECGISPEMTTLVHGKGRANPEELARLLIDGGKSVWVPQCFWPGDVVERGGWWIRFMKVANGRLEYQVLDRHEHHVEGDMAIWEPAGGRRKGGEGSASSLVRWHHRQGRAAITLWLEAGDLGQDPNPAAELIPALRSFWQRSQTLPHYSQARLMAPNQVIQPGKPYFAKRLTQGEALGPKIDCMEFDWSAVRMQREQFADGIVVTKGARAWLFKQEHNRGQWRRTGCNLKRSQPRLKREEGHLIEAARLAILDKDEGWRDQWATNWKLQRKWEADGHRTLAWELSSQLFRFGISTLVSQQVLTADPTFDTVAPFGDEPETGALVAMYEVNGAREEMGWNSLATLRTWAVCLRDDQLTPPRRTWLREHGQLWLSISKSDRAVYRRGWWTTGDRVLSRAKLKLSIWLCTGMVPTPPNLSATWPLTREAGVLIGRLARYLAVHPSYSLRREGEDLFATDGSLRKVGDVRSMGAAAVRVASGRGVGVRVGGGPVSSTRAELAGVFVAIRPGYSIRVLIDSEIAMRRLRSLTREDCRPREYELKDLDILRAIAQECSPQGTRVILTKVDGHSGDPLHSLADRLAVEAAADEEGDVVFDNGFRVEPSVVFEGKTGSLPVPWPSSVPRRWQIAAVDRAGDLTSRGTIVGSFLTAPGVGRRFLGAALRNTTDWAVRDWIRMVTPQALPTRDVLFTRKSADSPTCTLAGCDGGRQTLSHLLLRCGNPGVHGACTLAHDRIVSVLKRGFSAGRDTTRWWWETKVREVWPGSSGLDAYALWVPDGIGVDHELKLIHLVEVARTMDHGGDLLARRGAGKAWKYEALRCGLARTFPDYVVAVREFVVGVRGSCPEDRWVFHLSALGVGIGEQRRIMTQASQESVEGSWQVLKAWRAEAGPAVGVGGGPGSSRAQGPAPPGRQRPRASVRRGRTPKRLS